MSEARHRYDAVVVGSGPNGLAAAVTLAEAGLAVFLVEAMDTPGGGCRSKELTLPGFIHDVCAAVHPMAILSPAFRALALHKLGVQFAWSNAAVAHPLPDGNVAVLEGSVAATAESLGPDAGAWDRLMRPFADRTFLESLLGPVWFPGKPLLRKARFGLLGLRSCDSLVKRFTAAPARALLGGCAAHSILGLDRAGTASFGLVLALAGHVVGWPCVVGGSQQLVDALTRRFTALGGVLELGRRVTAFAELPPAPAVLFDLNPHQIAAICGNALPSRYGSRLLRSRKGPGVFKVDWALDAPIPWKNPECARATTVHVGGTYEEIRRSEDDVMKGIAPAVPFVLAAQQSLFDASRSPAGQHTGWAYCHVPNGCTENMTARIEAQIERFAPGFRDCVLARHTTSPAQLEAYNPAMIGGDIGGGANDLLHFLFRPTPRWNPYTTPNPAIFICSSSTPPGGGVHGMCGYLAARSALRKHFPEKIKDRTAGRSTKK